MDRDRELCTKAEASQELQEAVLILYHLATIAIEKGPASKVFHSDLDTMYVKNWALPQVQLQGVQLPITNPQAPPR